VTMFAKSRAFTEEPRPRRETVAVSQHDESSSRQPAPDSSRQHSRSADFLQTVIRTAAEGICVCAQSSSYPFITFSVWNDRMTELTGYTMTEINQVGWYQTVYPDEATRKRALERRERFLAGDDMRQEEWSIVRKDGVPRVLAISTSRVSDSDHTAAVAFITDVTDRKRAEEALRGSESRLAMSQRLAHMGSFDWDIASGKVWWSEELYRIYGRDPATFRPTLDAFLASMHPDDVEVVRTCIQSTLQENTPFNYELRILRPDGSIRWKRTVGVLDRDVQGTPVRLWGTCQDITEERQLAEHERALEDQLREARRLESIGVLAGGIAHEFNNLLTAILGHAELIEAELPAESKSREHLLPIRQAGDRAAELCRRMLAYAGKSRLILGKVDLKELASEAIAQHRAEIPVRFDSGSSATLVNGDVEQLRQLIGNLLANAVETSAKYVRLSLGFEFLDAKAIRQLSFAGALAPREFVFVEVQDDGPGMSSEILARAFEPFFSTKFAGRGLGLPVVLGVVRVHSGGLHIESSPGNGTTVRVYLPPAD